MVTNRTLQIKLTICFPPLFRKTYSDDKRKTIIQDNNHHTEGVSVVALTGLNDLNMVIDLNQGIKTTIRHLLLAVPAQGTRTNKLFLQIERQPTDQWLLCCFYSDDATEATLRLSSLETLLKRYVKQEEHPKLFASQEFTLKFNGQAAPIKKGENQKVIQGVSEETVQYLTPHHFLAHLCSNHLSILSHVSHQYDTITVGATYLTLPL